MSDQQDSVVNNFFIMIMAMAVMTVLLILLGTFIGGVVDKGPGPIEIAAADERIEPVGKVALADGTVFISSAVAPVVKEVVEEVAAVEPEPVAQVVMDGEAVYNTACMTCHATGLAGAPPYGDKGAWEQRIAKGIDVLYEHSIKGFQAMPPKGGFMHIPDDQINLAVDYMVEAAQ